MLPFSTGSDTFMTFEGKKISIEELKFFMIVTQPDKEGALDNLIRSLIMEKIAEDNNIVLTEDQKIQVKDYAQNMKDNITSNGLTMPDISDERFEAIISVNVVEFLNSAIADKIAENYIVDEAAFAVVLEGYRSEDKYCKYIVTLTQEQGDEARNALLSGMSFDEAIKAYSAYYSEEIGTDLIGLRQLGFNEESNADLMSLKQSEFSEVVMYSEGTYVIFMPATDKETADFFRAIYAEEEKSKFFNEELERMKSEADYKINEKVYDAFDAEAFAAAMYGNG